jgi:bacterioferritin-associated ferredoxin
MIICHCAGISDATIRKSVRQGATSLRAVARRCGAGRNCGSCRDEILALLADACRPEARPSNCAAQEAAGEPA